LAKHNNPYQKNFACLPESQKLKIGTSATQTDKQKLQHAKCKWKYLNNKLNYILNPPLGWVEFNA
jgi:hypothetical protein